MLLVYFRKATNAYFAGDAVPHTCDPATSRVHLGQIDKGKPWLTLFASVGVGAPVRGRFPECRVVPEDIEADIAAVDREMETLKARRVALVEEAWRRAEPLTLHWAREESARQLAARTAARVTAEGR